MELKEVYDLWDRFEKSNVTRMELKMPGIKLYLDKSSSDCASVPVNVKATEKNVVLKDADNTNEIAEDSNNEIIKSPLVGTFYKSPTPDSAPFITEGQAVKKGDKLGIIEAMKLMNEIIAPRDGVIQKILVEDQSYVEYEQPLFVIQ